MMASEPEVSNADEMVDREERRTSALDDFWARIDLGASTEERKEQAPNRLQVFPLLRHRYTKDTTSRTQVLRNVVVSISPSLGMS